MRIAPSECFNFESLAKWPSIDNYDDAVLEAVLDVFLTSSNPFLGIAVALTSIEWHEIDSCYLGYYLAAKAVAESIIENVQNY